MQWLSKECQHPPFIHNYYCKKAMASGKQWNEKVSNAAYAPSLFIEQTQISTLKLTQNISMEKI